MKIKKRYIILLSLLLLAVAFTVWVLTENKSIGVTEVTIESEKLPEDFSGYRIAQISDLHNETFGEDNESLLTAIENGEPDIIVITGDMIDSYDTDVDVAVSFAEKALEIAPCYYVEGNHERRIPEESERLKSALLEMGVTVLSNESTTLTCGDAAVGLIGLRDYSLSKYEKVLPDLSALIPEEGFSIVLSHKPDFFSEYAESGADLVLCGHAHGGQFRLPFIGGIVAPGQGLFPKYTEGVYSEGDFNMVVSRGLGNSIIPLRVNNPPEIVIIELKKVEL